MHPILLDADASTATLVWASSSSAFDVEWRKAGEPWQAVRLASNVMRKRNLEPGAAYEVRVKPAEQPHFREDGADVARWTHPTPAEVEARPPPPVVGMEIMPTDMQLGVATVQWSDPLQSSKYEVQFLPMDGSSGWITATDSASAPAIRKKNLPMGPAYVFRWRGLTAKGWGPWSGVSAPVTAPAPAFALAKAVAPELASHAGPVSAGSLAGKVVGLYFSAHWCPPCRQYTPMLIEFYKTLKALGKPFEVVFVSADQSKKQFEGYFGEMPWLAVPFDSERRMELPEEHRVSGIPSFVIISPETGKVIDPDARQRPLTVATFDHWQSLCQARR